METTVAPYSNPNQGLNLESAYLVLQNLNIQFNRKATPDPIKIVTASLTVYATHNAYNTNKEPIGNRNLNFELPIDADDAAIEAAIVERLNS